MEDKLKKHIEKNREDFEIYQTDLDMAWNEIDGRINKKKKKGPYLVFKIAASILLLISLAIAFRMGQQSVLINKNGIALHDVSSDMAETEAYYSNLIDQQMSIINANKKDIDTGTWSDIEKLDQDYQSLKKDLKEKADSKEVIEAMIRYYRIKLNMLEKISIELQQNDHEEDAISI